MPGMIAWLKARAENVAVALLAAMFAAFVLQIVSRYVLNDPLGWTLELCLTTWLWAVFWGAAFCLDDGDHVKFDLLYVGAPAPVRRVFAIVSAVAIVAGFLAALPATVDYVTFYKIKRSATLHLRLDWVFSVYLLFAAAVIVRYAIRAWRSLRGAPPEAAGETGVV